MGQDGQGLALAVLAGQLAVQLPARFVALEEELGCQGEGPAQMGVADLLAGGAEFLAIRFLDAGGQSAIGGKVLNPGETVDVLDLVKQVESIDPAHAGNAFEQGIGSGVMLLGVGDDILLQYRQHPVVGIDHIQIGGHGHPHRRLVEPLQQPLPVLWSGDPAQRILEIVLTSGILGVGEELGPFAHEMIAPAHQIPRGPHLLRVDVGHGDQPSSQQGGDLLGVDLVVLALAAVDGPHVERVSENEGDVFFGTEIGQPVPGEHALGADHQIIPVRSDGLEEGCRFGLDVAMEQDVPFLTEDAQVHFVGVQIDSAIMLVLFGVQSHEKASLLRVC